MDTGTVAIIAISLAAFVVVLLTYLADRQRTVAKKSRERFRRIRRQISDARARHAQATYGYYREQFYPLSVDVTNTPIVAPYLFRREWIPARPLPLSSVHTEVVDPQPPVSSGLRPPDSWAATCQEFVSRSRALLPYASANRHFPDYVTAIQEIEQPAPARLYNGDSWRLLEVSASSNSYELRLGKAKYFEKINTQEILAYELASTDRPPERPDRLRLRGRIRPSDLHNRCVTLGISTLTLLREEGNAWFCIQERRVRNRPGELPITSPLLGNSNQERGSVNSTIAIRGTTSCANTTKSSSMHRLRALVLQRTARVLRTASFAMRSKTKP